MKYVMISGHLDLTDNEFNTHYVPLIDKAIKDGHKFIVGDAKGCDEKAQAYLKAKGIVGVTVFHMLTTPRNNVGDFSTTGGFISDSARDQAMTGSSDYDIAWVRKGREKSGTAENLRRRESFKISIL